MTNKQLTVGLVPGKLYRLADVNWHRFCSPCVEFEVFPPGVYMLVSFDHVSLHPDDQEILPGLLSLEFLVGRQNIKVRLWADEIDMWIKAVN